MELNAYPSADREFDPERWEETKGKLKNEMIGLLRGTARSPAQAAFVFNDIAEVINDLRGKETDPDFLTSEKVNTWLGLPAGDTNMESVGEFATGPLLVERVMRKALPYVLREGVEAVKPYMKTADVIPADVFYHRSKVGDLNEVKMNQPTSGATTQGELDRYGDNRPVYAYRPDIDRVEPSIAGTSPYGYDVTVPQHEIYDMGTDPANIFGSKPFVEAERSIPGAGYRVDSPRTNPLPGPQSAQHESLRLFGSAPADESDILQLSYDATPGPATRELPLVTHGNLRLQQAYLNDINAVLNPDGESRLLRALQLQQAGKPITGTSRWAGKPTAGAQLPIKVKRLAGKNADPLYVDQNMETKVRQAADAHRRVLDQDAVGYHAPVFGGEGGLDVYAGKQLTKAQEQKLAKAVAKEFGESVTAPITTPKGVRFLNFGADDFEKRMENIVRDIRMVDNPVYTRRFRPEGGLEEGGVKQSASVEALIKELRGEIADVKRRYQ